MPRRTASDKVLRDKAFNIAKNPKYDGYQCGLTSMAYKVFDKKSFNTDTLGGPVIRVRSDALATQKFSYVKPTII